MSEPDDDFDDNFDSDDTVEETTINNPTLLASDAVQYDTRRKIEEMLEKRRLRAEFGDMAEF